MRCVNGKYAYQNKHKLKTYSFSSIMLSHLGRLIGPLKPQTVNHGASISFSFCIYFRKIHSSNGGLVEWSKADQSLLDIFLGIKTFLAKRFEPVDCDVAVYYCKRSHNGLNANFHLPTIFTSIYYHQKCLFRLKIWKIELKLLSLHTPREIILKCQNWGWNSTFRTIPYGVELTVVNLKTVTLALIEL